MRNASLIGKLLRCLGSSDNKSSVRWLQLSPTQRQDGQHR